MPERPAIRHQRRDTTETTSARPAPARSCRGRSHPGCADADGGPVAVLQPGREARADASPRSAPSRGANEITSICVHLEEPGPPVDLGGHDPLDGGGESVGSAVRSARSDFRRGHRRRPVRGTPRVHRVRRHAAPGCQRGRRRIDPQHPVAGGRGRGRAASHRAARRARTGGCRTRPRRVPASSCRHRGPGSMVADGWSRRRCRRSRDRPRS